MRKPLQYDFFNSNKLIKKISLAFDGFGRQQKCGKFLDMELPC